MQEQFSVLHQDKTKEGKRFLYLFDDNCDFSYTKVCIILNLDIVGFMFRIRRSLLVALVRSPSTQKVKSLITKWYSSILVKTAEVVKHIGALGSHVKKTVQAVKCGRSIQL